jgi:hypothetical protein
MSTESLVSRLLDCFEDSDGCLNTTFTQIMTNISGSDIDQLPSMFIKELSESAELDSEVVTVIESIFADYYKDQIPQAPEPPIPVRRHHKSKGTVKHKTVTCPLCRKVSQIGTQQPKVCGIDVKCSVCLDNNVQIFLPSCGHVCLCDDCFQKISK